MLHARTSALASRGRFAPHWSGCPGGVYLDLAGEALPQTVEAEAGKQSLIKVVDAAPRQIPAQDAVNRALDL